MTRVVDEPRVVLEVAEAPGEVEHGAAGVGRHQLLGAAVDQLLADLALQALDRQRDGRLRPVELFGGARKAALADDRGEDLQRVELHGGMAEYNERLSDQELL